MDRETTVRTTLVIVLTLGAVLAWTWFFPPPRPEPQAPPAEMPAVEPATPPPAEAAPPPSDETVPAERREGEAEREAEPFEEVIEGEPDAGPIEVFTPYQEILLSSRGGRVLSWKLLEHPRDVDDPDSEPVDLVSPAARALDRHPLVIDPRDPDLFERINDAWYRWERTKQIEPEVLREKNLPDGTERIRFRWADGRGLAAVKTLYIPGDDRYLSRVEWSLRLNGRPLPGAMLTWGPGLGRPFLPESSYNRTREQVLVAQPAGIDEFDADELSADLSLHGPRFLALDDRYFAAAMIPSTAAAAAVEVFEELPVVEEEGGLRRVAIGSAAEEMLLFTGPKRESLLQRLDAELETGLEAMVDWGFMGIIARPLYVVLSWMNDVLGNWGWAIIVVTVIIKILFVPLTHRSMVSMRKTQEKMGRVQPKIHKIREKYRDKRDMESRRKQQEEMMRLYQQEGINPMSSAAGCLPLLLQLPVLFAMFTVLTVAIELRGAEFFGWIDDLSGPDPLRITPIVMGLTMFVQQYMSMTRTEDPQQRTQQRIMMLMPIMFLWFFWTAPSGLVIYWLVNNVLGIAQQYFINRHSSAPRRAPAAG
jgi:YidC/Oxa1 family membrane protein insertase